MTKLPADPDMEKRKKKAAKIQTMKKIMAWCGIIILVVLYLTTFILGITASEATRGFFMASVICTVLVPVVMYAMLMIARVLSGTDSDKDI